MKKQIGILIIFLFFFFVPNSVDGFQSSKYRDVPIELMPKKQKRDSKPSEIKIAKGDTYYSIAKKYKLSIKDLLKYNNVTEKDLLKEGKKIKIPKR